MKKGAMLTLTALGLALAVVGLSLIKAEKMADGVMAALPYVLIGLGCGAFGHGLGELLGGRALDKAPDIKKQLEIEQQDERNIAIANRAKGKAYDAMLYIFGALMISFALMDVPLYVTLLLVFAYLLVVGVSIYYRCRYNREM